jgi:hypothetical protein
MRETIAAIVAIAALVVGAAFAVLLPAAPSHAYGGQGGTGSGTGPNFAGGGTMSGTLTFSGVTNDIVTTGNEDLTLAPGGTGSVVLTSGDKQIDIVGLGGTSKIDVATSGVVFLLGPSIAGVGATANRTIGQTAAGFYDNAGANNLFTVDGVGILHMITGVSANNALTGTAACAAAGNVGDIVLYNDTSTSKITECVCEQTGAGTFAWGAVTAVGDCT